MANESVRNAIAQLAADRQQLETRIRQIDQSIHLLESIAFKSQRVTPRPDPSARRPMDRAAWQT